MFRKNFPYAALVAAAVFMTIVCVALAANISLFFHDDVLPFSDYASNDILIVWAKELSLWHGNYSRVGFYHPGPFFFQFMAWSEIAFHDLLPIFHSAFAAQIFATLCLCAFAIALVSAFLYKLTGNVFSSVAGTTVYLNVLLLAKAYSFTAPWPPFLYVSASTVLCVGLCGILLWGWRWMPWLILGAGAMVHGHASFVGLLPVICAVVISGSWLGIRLRWLINPLSVRPPKSTLAISLLLIGLFLLPVLMQTLAHWPGEFPKYFSFAGHRDPNPMSAVGRYVFDFMPFWGWALPLIGLIGWKTRGTDHACAILIGLLVLVAGLLAALFYARKGVDDLQYRYLEYWFVPFYAILIAIATAGTVERTKGPVRAVILLFLVGTTVYMGSRSEELLQNPASVSEAPYRDALRALLAIADGKPVEVLIDREGGWDMGWSDAVSLLAYAHRVQHEKAAICISPSSWHLLFHEQYLCPTAGERLKVVVSASVRLDANKIISTPHAWYYLDEGNNDSARDFGSVVGVGNDITSDSRFSMVDAAATVAQEGPLRIDEKTGMVSLRVKILNRSTMPLAGRGKYPVNLAVVQLPETKGDAHAFPRIEIRRIPLPGIAPGAEVTLPLTLPLSVFSNGSVVRLELVQEGVAWFSYDYGLPPLDIGPL